MRWEEKALVPELPQKITQGESAQESAQESESAKKPAEEAVLNYIVVHNGSSVHVAGNDDEHDHHGVDEIDQRNQIMYDGASAKSDSTGSTISCYSGVHVQFMLSADEMRFTEFVRLCVIFTSIHTISASVSFFSSMYPVLIKDEQQTHTRNSTVDAFVLTSNIMEIDISSAFFVLCGFFCAYTVTNLNSENMGVLYSVIAINILVDVWLATLISIVFGSLFHVLRGTFAAHNVLLTFIEGLTCLRTLELNQSPEKMHSLNPTSWPVMCLLYCFLVTPWTMSSNKRLHSCYPKAGLTMLIVNSLLPIVTISLFALLHEDTNIFFINSTHFGYRILEFNLGICFFTCIQTYPHASTHFTYAVKYLYVAVICTFLLTWWAQLGTPVVSYYGTCIRMYYFSPCIKVHHGLLMRGCFLGVTLISHIVLSIKQPVVLPQEVDEALSTRHGILLANSMSTVVFIWPMCYVVHILLELNFNESLVQENASIFVLIVPCMTWGLCLLWNRTWKCLVADSMLRILYKIITRCIKKV